MPNDPTVHVIDDDEAVRQSLAFLLRSANVAVATYESAASFLSALPGIHPGCVVTDVRMPEMDGIELLRRVRATHIRLPVIVITGHGDVAMAVEAMKVGAVDFIEKPFDDEAFLAAVRAALSEHEQIAQEHSERTALIERLETLSTRERQVLESLVTGSPNKIIAFDLGISPRTVEIYRANVMTKMQADSLPQLVRMALVAGILAREK
jgi:two-component system response regulator FixJ